VLAAALAWVFIPETKSVGDPGVSETPPVPFLSQVRILTGHTGFMLVSLVRFMNAVARTGGLFNVIPLLAHDRLALNADRIGLGLALASLVGLVVIYPSGVLVDRYGRKSVIVPATVMAGISLVLFLLVPSYAWFLAGCVAWSVAAGVGGAAPAAYAADVAPPGMNAAAMSGFRMLADLGYVVGPIALGLATDLAGADATLGGPPSSSPPPRCSSPASPPRRTGGSTSEPLPFAVARVHRGAGVTRGPGAAQPRFSRYTPLAMMMPQTTTTVVIGSPRKSQARTAARTGVR